MSQINHKRRQLQEAAVEALASNEYNGFAVLPTGTGKAWILIECLKRLNPKGHIWYLCDSEENRDNTFRKELIEWGAEKWIDRIEFMCYQSAYKYQNEDIEVCLADEADYALTDEYIKGLKNNNFKHLICVSATLEDKKRTLAESIVPVVFEKHLNEIEDLGILNSARHYLVNYLLNDKENKEYLEFSSKFVKLLDNPKRNQKQLEMLQIHRKQFLSALDTSRNICRRLLKNLHAVETNKILIFCGLTDQADSICKYSYHSNSDSDNLTLFDQGDIRVLTVVGKVDRGVNLDGVNNIVFEAPARSQTKFTQKTGRGRRLDLDEILSCYYLIPYYKNRRGEIVPTVVKDWVRQSTAKINFKPTIYQFK
jgi:superfamily II DNA or RNA helicase